MKEYENIFRQMETDTIILKKCQHHSIGYYEVVYEIDQKPCSFRVAYYKKDHISISLQVNKMKEQKERRKKISELVNHLIQTFETSPKYRLKVLTNKITIEFKDDKYLILDVDQFEARKQKQFVKKHQETIKSYVRMAIQEAKNSQPHRKKNEFFLLIKEEDELPLMEFFVKQKLMRIIATFDGEYYLKLNTTTPVNHILFFKRFKEDMKQLGYNLCPEGYVGGDEGYYQDLGHYDDFDEYGWFDDDDDKWYPKKQKVKIQNKRKQKKRYEIK